MGRASRRARWEMAAGAAVAASFNPIIAGATPQVFDVSAVSVSVTLPARNVGDRLHPTDAGYAAIAARVFTDGGLP